MIDMTYEYLWYMFPDFMLYVSHGNMVMKFMTHLDQKLDHLR